MSKLTPGWQSTAVLESVFDQLSDALVLYDPEFRITGVNRSAEKLFGMAPMKTPEWTSARWRRWCWSR